MAIRTVLDDGTANLIATLQIDSAGRWPIAACATATATFRDGCYRFCSCVLNSIEKRHVVKLFSLGSEAIYANCAAANGKCSRIVCGAEASGGVGFTFSITQLHILQSYSPLLSCVVIFA